MFISRAWKKYFMSQPAVSVVGSFVLLVLTAVGASTTVQPGNHALAGQFSGESFLAFVMRKPSQDPHNIDPKLEDIRDVGREKHAINDPAYVRCMSRVPSAARRVCCVPGATVRSMQSDACQKALGFTDEKPAAPEDQVEQAVEEPQEQQDEPKLEDMPPEIQNEVNRLKKEMEEFQQLALKAKALYDQGLACEWSCPCGARGLNCPEESVAAQLACIQRCDVNVPAFQAMKDKLTKWDASIKQKATALKSKIEAVQKGEAGATQTKKGGRTFRAIKGATRNR